MERKTCCQKSWSTSTSTWPLRPRWPSLSQHCQKCTVLPDRDDFTRSNSFFLRDERMSLAPKRAYSFARASPKGHNNNKQGKSNSPSWAKLGVRKYQRLEILELVHRQTLYLNLISRRNSVGWSDNNFRVKNDGFITRNWEVFAGLESGFTLSNRIRVT